MDSDEAWKQTGDQHQQTAHCENLAKLAKPCETKNLIAKPCETCICESLRKLVFAKPCESCETNVKLRNLYLRNLAKLVFAKLAKHDLRNLPKHCETLIAKIAKVAKIELHCEAISQKSLNNTVRTACLLWSASACQGNHIEMPQSTTVARALRLITESTWVVPFWQCLTLRTVTGRRKGGAGRHRAAACGGRRGHGRPQSKRQARRGAPRRS